MPNIECGLCQGRQPGQLLREPKRRQVWTLHRSLRVVRQPLHMLLMEQAAYFRLMRKHSFLPSFCRRVVDGLVCGVRRQKRALSFRNGSCFSDAENGANGLDERSVEVATR